jgi:Cu-Zn family superoxide dismutase
MAPPETPALTANLVRSDGAPSGTVRVFTEPTGLLLRIDASGLPPGQHGVHLHATGRCDPPGFTSAGAHWNPTQKQHGHLNPAGWHRGDLGNLGAGADGRIVAGLLVPGATIAELHDADGTAFVMHARPDDERTDPSGNSGDRIACAVL